MRNILTILMVLPSLLQAAGEAGNGGDVVVCKQNGQVTSIKVLDFHEAEVMRPTLKHDLGHSSLSVDDKVERALTRLSGLDPERAKRYQLLADGFFGDVRFVQGVNLQDIDDSGYVPIPAHCKVEQIAVQKPPAFPEDRLYTINRDLWDQLDNDHKAGLVLHEIVYGELIGLGHTNSVKARYFTSLISSPLPGLMSQAEYDKRLRVVIGNIGPLPGNLEFTANTYSYVIKAGPGCAPPVDLLSLLKGQGNGRVKWSMIPSASWIELDNNTHQMKMCPRREHVGQHQFRLAAQDKDMGVLAQLKVTVVYQGVPPIWLQDPIVFTSAANQAFMADLSSYARDPDGDPLTFSKLSGPAWLMVDTAGRLSGTPTPADAGTNSFIVRVTDGTGMSEQATVRIQVTSPAP